MFSKREAERYDYPTLSIYNDAKSPHFCKQQLGQVSLRKLNSILYVHIPFCANQCIFCNYYKTSNITAELIKTYFKALHKELDFYSQLFAKQIIIQGIHFGGGTPSVVPAKYYHDLITHIRNIFILINPVISFEGNINSLNRIGYIKELRAAGVNRISFGIQTFDQKIRSFLHLHGDLSAIRDLCNLLRREGINNYNADLMFNLPYQTPQCFEEDIEKAFELGVSAIDLYSLLVYPETIMFQYLREHNLWNSYSSSFSINQYEKVFYKYAQDKRYSYLMANTISQNSILSNVLLETQLGNNTPHSNNVIGIGASSRGYMSGFKYKNYVDIHAYIKAVLEESIGIQLCRILSDREIMSRWIVLSPNFMHIDLQDGIIPEEKQKILNKLVAKGILLKKNSEYAFVSGMNFWSGNVSSLLMDDIEQKRMKEMVLKNRKNHLNMYNQDKMQIIEDNNE